MPEALLLRATIDEALRERGESSVSDLSEALSIPKEQVEATVSELVSLGVVSRLPNGKIRPYLESVAPQSPSIRG